MFKITVKKDDGTVIKFETDSVDKAVEFLKKYEDQYGMGRVKLTATHEIDLKGSGKNNHLHKVRK